MAEGPSERLTQKRHPERIHVGPPILFVEAMTMTTLKGVPAC